MKKPRAMSIERFNGRISVIGQGGKFNVLEGIEKKVIESVAKKDAAKERRAEAKAKPRKPKPRKYGKVRAFREYDYTKRS